MKAKKDLQRGKAVRVCWIDSSTLHGWTEKEVPGRTGKIVSLGYITDVQRDCLTISTSIAENSHSMSPLSIPWACIEDLQILPPDYDRNSNLPK